MNLRFPRIAANDDKSLGCRKGGGADVQDAAAGLHG